MNNKIGKLRATKPVKDFELGVWCSRIVNDEFENTDVIADVYGEDENEAIATAVLMAGAPALLEALELALPALGYMGGNIKTLEGAELCGLKGLDDYKHEKLRSAWEAARAALKQAKGE